MSKILAKSVFRLQRFILNRYGWFALFGAAVLCSRGFFEDVVFDQHHWKVIASVALLGAMLLGRLLIGRPPNRSSVQRDFDRLETGLLVLLLIYVGIQSTGGPSSRFQPLIFLALAGLVGFNKRWVGAFLALGAMALQGTIHFAAGELPQTWIPFAYQCCLLLLFSVASMIFLQIEVTRQRREHRDRLSREILEMREEARDFRLVGPAVTRTPGGDRAAEEGKLAQGAVEAIHQSMFFVLELLKKSLDLQTCVLLWLDATGRKLKIKELLTDSDMVREVPISASAGALGGVVKKRILLNLRHPQRSSRGIPYYDGPEDVGAFLGVPVIEKGHLRGVLCADRRQNDEFTKVEEQLMMEASMQVLRAIQTERVFAAVERSKYEHERFYLASSMLNNALTLSEVYETAFTAAREISEFDFGAITLFNAGKRKHIICRVVGEERERFEGEEFGQNAGLVSMVVKNKHFLPVGDDMRERDTMIFTKKLRVRGMESLAVLPLIVQDNAIGAFVLASRKQGGFSKKIREMLGVITNQVAVSIENAKMYKQMEEMATTDGLTGLPNHRTFQSRCSEMLHRSERHNKPVSIVLTDIDKFKRVNDTYGHPVGDAVLRRVSKVLATQIRKVDHVARYGGEEFVMVLEETDEAGARLFCERVRKEVAAQVMSSEQGAFRVTISLGICSYPQGGDVKELLIERADQALYAAKEGGRNRTVCFSEIQKVKHEETIRSRHQCASS